MGRAIIENDKITKVAGNIQDITERKEAEEELKVSREQLRNLTAHIQAAREQERTAIAREIHDELGQTLTALKIDISGLEKEFLPEQKSLLNVTESMKSLINSTSDVVERISSDLRPGLLDDLGLIDAIDWYAREFQKRTNIECKVVLPVDISNLDRDIVTALYRITQETLTNIARHSKAKKVIIELAEKNKELILTVKDNGIGISEKQISDSKSYGLLGMRERARYFGGDMIISGSKNKGTTIVAYFPINASGETS